jgi:phage tail-like protein
MDGDRGYSLVAHPDQWARCSHSGTTLLDGGGVQLGWDEVNGTDDGTCKAHGTAVVAATGVGGFEPCAAGAEPAGLAFDRGCTGYRSEPERDRVVTVPPPARPAGAQSSAPSVQDAAPGVFRNPQGLDIDCGQLLYVAETGAGRIAVLDLWSGRVLRRIPVRTREYRQRRPVDVAGRRCGAYVLLQHPACVVTVAGRAGPRPGPALLRPRIRPGRLVPWRLATSVDNGLLVLWRNPDGDACVATVDGRPVLTDLAGSTDLAVTPDGVLVVGGADGPLRRFRLVGEGLLELEPLFAAGFDGAAIAVAPNGRIAFTTPTGIAWTGGPQVVRRTRGRVVGYRLDAGQYRTRWGRVFLDACLPAGTGVGVRFLSTDDDTVIEPIDWQLAERSSTPVRRPDLTPPLPPEGLPGLTAPVPPFRRPTGRERPWAQLAAEDRFETYETPVTAPPGRYLWIVLDLTGTTAATPRVRELRVERPGHRLLAQLPRSWSRDEVDAGFLQRFLAPAEGMLHELDQRAARREVLLNPQAVPQEALPWLAGLTGLVLDRRWPEPARRALVASAYPLFRRRGTLWALRRILSIYLGRDPVILERWRLRGIPGAVLGLDPDGPASSVLGGGMRAGGSLASGATAGGAAAQDGYQTAAHRFSVLVPMDLTTEQLDVVTSVVQQHKPAHTAFEVCELGLGMRVGRHLHLDLTSVVGPDAGFGPALVGQVAVGGDGVVGIPAVGSRLGETATAGGVRVG